MARLKLVLGMMMHETNTFSPVPTPLASFRPLQGEAAIAEFKDTNTQLGGFLDVAQRAGAEIVLPVAGGGHRGRGARRLRRGLPRAARGDGGRARRRRRGRAAAAPARGGAAGADRGGPRL